MDGSLKRAIAFQAALGGLTLPMPIKGSLKSGVGFSGCLFSDYSVAFSIFSPTWEMPRPTALPPFFAASWVLSQPCPMLSPTFSTVLAVSVFTPCQVLEQAASRVAIRVNANALGLY